MIAKTVHDFNKENLVLMVLGGYIILQKPTINLIINVMFLISILTLYIFLLTMAIYTMIIMVDDKVILIQAFHTLALLGVAIAVPSIKHLTEKSIRKATNMLNGGVFTYEEESTDYDEIKSRRVDLIRKLIPRMGVMCGFGALSNTFTIPLVQLLTSSGDTAPGQINPYLPLPLYMPFNTTSPLGYTIAFMSNGMFISFMFTSIACFQVAYLSGALQLIGQIEVLNYSLGNLEQRAFRRWKKIVASEELLMTRSVYEDPGFQKCIFFCFRENIMHHQAILRLSQYVAPYLEAVNFIAIIFFSIVMGSSIILFSENPSVNIAVLMTLICDVVGYLMVCWLGQMITDQSSETANALYSTPWPFFEEDIKVLQKIMSVNIQKPIVLKTAIFNSSSSLETYANMISVGYKVVNLLR